MKTKRIVTISLAIIAVAALTQIFLPRRAEALDQTLPVLRDGGVTCGVTATAIHTALTSSNIASLACENPSATCVRVGGSTVGAAGGLAYGDGCTGGKILSMDVARAWCISSAPVALTCTFATR